MKKNWLYLLIAMLAWALSAQAAPTPVSSCNTVLDERGAYFLTTDLTCPETGVTITAKNVHLDLKGHTIAFDVNGGGLWAGILILADNASINGNGGTLEGFNYGALIGLPPFGPDLTERSAKNCKIQGVKVTDNTNAGIAAGWGSSNNHIIGNTAMGNLRGILLFEKSPGNLIKDNIASQNFIGILIHDSNMNQILHNTTNNNVGETDLGIITGFGISLRNGASRNVVQGNTANDNGRWGIASTGNELSPFPTNNNILVNTAQGNVWDLADYDSTCTNNWVNNTFDQEISIACMIK